MTKEERETVKELREDRASTARHTLSKYRSLKSQTIEDEADLRDLLADLMHYCREEKVDFNQELAWAQGNFRAE